MNDQLFIVYNPERITGRYFDDNFKEPETIKAIEFRGSEDTLRSIGDGVIEIANNIEGISTEQISDVASTLLSENNMFRGVNRSQLYAYTGEYDNSVYIRGDGFLKMSSAGFLLDLVRDEIDIEDRIALEEKIKTSVTSRFAKGVISHNDAINRLNAVHQLIDFHKDNGDRLIDVEGYVLKGFLGEEPIYDETETETQCQYQRTRIIQPWFGKLMKLFKRNAEWFPDIDKNYKFKNVIGTVFVLGSYDKYGVFHASETQLDNEWLEFISDKNIEYSQLSQ